MTSSLSDEELIDAHLAGDPQAFAELVQRHQDYLWRLASRVIGDSHAAQDIVQEALLSAFRNLGGFRRDAAFKTWLCQITWNACSKYLRKDRSLRSLSTDKLDVAGRSPDRDLGLDVRQALDLLPYDEWVPIMLVDVGGWSNSDAAAVLGIDELTIKKRRARGRAALRRRLDGEL